jgi:hypothetical protein
MEILFDPRNNKHLPYGNPINEISEPLAHEDSDTTNRHEQETPAEIRVMRIYI